MDLQRLFNICIDIRVLGIENTVGYFLDVQ